MSRQRAEEILQELDEDGDGEISLEELLQAFKLEEPGEGLAGLLDLFIKEVRFEISSTPFNGPILLTLSTAAFLGFFWKYISAIELLRETELDWLPDSLSLLQTVPQGFLADYGSAVALAPRHAQSAPPCGPLKVPAHLPLKECLHTSTTTFAPSARNALTCLSEGQGCASTGGATASLY